MRRLATWLAGAAVLLGAQAAPPPPSAPLPAVQAPTAQRAAPAVGQAPPRVARRVPAERLRALRANPAYEYDRPVVERVSLWDRLWGAVWHLLARLATAAGPTGTQWILWSLAIVAVGWALSRLLRADVGGPFRATERARPPGAGALLDVDDIAEVDLDALLKRARADGDRRAEVRLRYLVLLQRLAAAGAVAWARDKTNRTYAAEVRAWQGGAVAEPFGRATRLFEHVWYGDYDATPARAARLSADAEAAEAVLGAPA